MSLQWGQWYWQFGHLCLRWLSMSRRNTVAYTSSVSFVHLLVQRRRAYPHVLRWLSRDRSSPLQPHPFSSLLHLTLSALISCSPNEIGHNITDLSTWTLFNVPNNWFPCSSNMLFEPPRRGQPLYKGHNNWIYIFPKVSFVWRFDCNYFPHEWRSGKCFFPLVPRLSIHPSLFSTPLPSTHTIQALAILNNILCTKCKIGMNFLAL